jgi:phage portal protein BeeE
MLIYPSAIDEVEEQRVKEQFEQRFSRQNLGRTLILSSGAKYEKVAMTNVEGQMVESLKWSAEVVCSVYHVPPYKVGVGALPTYNNVQALNIEYYSQGLQAHIEGIEELLDHGLGLGGYAGGLGTEFDIENLLRMDSVTQMAVIKDGVGASIIAPNEGRAKLGYKPVKGGKQPLSQQQYYSLEALAKRDAQADPFAPAMPPAPPQPAAQDDPAEPAPAKPAPAKDIAQQFTRALQAAHREAA